MSFNKKKAAFKEHPDINRISNMKSNINNINLKQEYLNIKRKRGKDIEKEEKDDSNETHTETRDTVFRKRINKKEVTISDSPENNSETNNKNANQPQNNKKRLNRFMRKKREHFIKLREENKKRAETSSKNEEINTDNIICDDERTKKNKRKQIMGVNKIKNSRIKRARRNNSFSNNKAKFASGKDKAFEQKLTSLETNFNEKINNLFNLFQNAIGNLNLKEVNQDNAIKNLNIKSKNQERKSKNQANTIRNLERKSKNKTNTIRNLNKKVYNLNKEMQEQKMKTSLLSEIYKQSKIYSNELNNYVMHIGNKFICLFNTCKILFVRKICDFILEGLIQEHGRELAKTLDTFTNNNGINFRLIVFKENTEDNYINNLIIDFLMETKQNCSQEIHMCKIDQNKIPLMKELFYIIMNKNKENKKESDNDFNINIYEMVNIILDTNQQKNELSELNEIQEEEESEIIEPNDEENEISELNNNYLNKTDEQIIEDVIKNIENNNTSNDDLLKILKEEIKNNRKRIQVIADKINQEINSSYFYQFWIDSFDKEEYKKSEEYKIFINKNLIPSLTEMKNKLIQLLPNYKINFFSEDPSKFTEKVRKTIIKY